MNLLEHFIAKNELYTILELNNEEIDDFVKKLPEKFRKCYISDEELKNRKDNLGKQTNEILQNYIPDPGHIMSGEFGEILSYHLLKEKCCTELRIEGPKKWRWKEDRNKPCPKTDVILFAKNEEDSKKDMLISAESKAKATKNKTYDPIQNAINGARKDSLQRLSESLVWLKERMVKENNKAGLEYIERFRNPLEYGTYKKHFKAIAIIDSDFLESELNRDRDNTYKVKTKKEINELKTDLNELDIEFDEDEKIINFADVTRDEIQATNVKYEEKILYYHSLANFQLKDDSEVIIVAINDLKEIYESTYENICIYGGD